MNEKKKTGKSSPRPAKSRRRAFIGAGAAVVVVAVYAGYWNYIAAQVRAGIEQWADMRRADGFEVSYGALSIGGFPFRLVAQMAAPKVVHSWSWQGPTLVISARPWRLGRFKVKAPGLHQVSYGGGDYFIDAATFRAKLRFRRGAPVKIRLSVTDLVARNAADQDVAGIDTAEVLIDLSGNALLVDADGLLAPRERIPGLGRMTRHLGIEAQATGAFPDIAQAMPVNGETMARWRDSGGTIEVHRLNFKHGPLTVSSDGTLALDQAMQPIGSFTIKAQGHMEALDRFRDAGLITANDHGLTRLALTALSKGSSGLKVPLTVQDRRVFVGPVPLAKLPLVSWP